MLSVLMQICKQTNHPCAQTSLCNARKIHFIINRIPSIKYQREGGWGHIIMIHVMNEINIRTSKLAWKLVHKDESPCPVPVSIPCPLWNFIWQLSFQL
jgi:hypothetical protein